MKATILLQTSWNLHPSYPGNLFSPLQIEWKIKCHHLARWRTAVQKYSLVWWLPVSSEGPKLSFQGKHLKVLMKGNWEKTTNFQECLIWMTHSGKSFSLPNTVRCKYFPSTAPRAFCWLTKETLNSSCLLFSGTLFYHVLWQSAQASQVTKRRHPNGCQHI